MLTLEQNNKLVCLGIHFARAIKCRLLLVQNKVRSNKTVNQFLIYFYPYNINLLAPIKWKQFFRVLTPRHRVSPGF